MYQAYLSLKQRSITEKNIDNDLEVKVADKQNQTRNQQKMAVAYCSKNIRCDNVSVIDIDSEDDIEVLETRHRKNLPKSKNFSQAEARGVQTNNYRDICVQQRKELSGAFAAAQTHISNIIDDEIQEVGRRYGGKGSEEGVVRITLKMEISKHRK